MAALAPQVGKLRERVRFDRLSLTPDGAGGQVKAWNTLIASRYAELTPTRGGEQVIADRLQGVAAFDLVVRFDSQTAAITVDDRVVNARNPALGYKIKWIGNLDERRKYLWMMLELGVVEG